MLDVLAIMNKGTYMTKDIIQDVRFLQPVHNTDRAECEEKFAKRIQIQPLRRSKNKGKAIPITSREGRNV
jgi:hypothetical protein